MLENQYEAVVFVENLNIEAVNDKFALKYEGVEFDDLIYLYELIRKTYNIKKNTARDRFLKDKINFLTKKMLQENWQYVNKNGD